MNTIANQSTQTGGHRVCPWWVGYLMDNPLRRMMHPADKILSPYVQKGMTVLDLGCGFGHYALGLARLVGRSGRVFAVDVQQKMLDKTMAKARKAGLDGIIHPQLTDGCGVGLSGRLDFALVANALHETPDPAAILNGIFELLVPGGQLLVMEPMSHMKPGEFDLEVSLAASSGFMEAGRPRVLRQLCVLFKKPEDPGAP